MIFGDFLRRDSKVFGDEEALVFQDRRYTYRQLGERVNRLTNTLIKLGAKKGDRIAVLSMNCNQYLELYCAIANAGAVIVPLNFRLNTSELMMILEDAGPNILFFSIDFLDRVEKIKLSSRGINHYILIDGENKGFVSYEDLLNDSISDEPNIKMEENDNLCLLYTSGTISQAKGVVLTHKNLVANTFNLCVELNIQPGSINLQLSPLYHASNNHVFNHLLIHGKNILIKHFDPTIVLETIERERVTYMFAVPTMIYALMDVPEFNKYDLRSLRTITFGGASITDKRLGEANEKFGSILTQGYGLTEGTAYSSILSKEEHKYVKNSIGRGMTGVEVKIVDDRGNQVKPGEIGEIIFRGDIVMKEYWNRPDLTSESLVDGWFHTGDLAKYDDRGYMYVVDRKKDLIISGGVNIYPRDIEEVIARHPAVAEVAVFGIPDDKWGESIKAAIVLKSGKKVTEEEIINYTSEHIARYKSPKSVVFVGELPKGPSGKILKRELKKFHEK